MTPLETFVSVFLAACAAISFVAFVFTGSGVAVFVSLLFLAAATWWFIASQRDR